MQTLKKSPVKVDRRSVNRLVKTIKICTDMWLSKKKNDFTVPKIGSNIRPGLALRLNMGFFFFIVYLIEKNDFIENLATFWQDSFGTDWHDCLGTFWQTCLR